MGPLMDQLDALLGGCFIDIQNMVGTKLERRSMSTFGFGLVHGFALSFALPEMLQFGGTHVFVSRFAFNIGIELGLLLVLAFLYPVLSMLFRWIGAQQMGIIVLSVFIAHSGWHWMTDHLSELIQFQFQRPRYDAFFVASAIRWTMLLVIISGILWLGRSLLTPSAPRGRPSGTQH